MEKGIWIEPDPYTLPLFLVEHMREFFTAQCQKEVPIIGGRKGVGVGVEITGISFTVCVALNERIIIS